MVLIIRSYQYVQNIEKKFFAIFYPVMEKVPTLRHVTIFSELARLAILLIQRSHGTTPEKMTILMGSSFHRENSC